MIVEVLPFVHNIPWCITKGFLFYIIFKWYRNLSLLIKKKGESICSNRSGCYHICKQLQGWLL